MTTLRTSHRERKLSMLRDDEQDLGIPAGAMALPLATTPASRPAHGRRRSVVGAVGLGLLACVGATPSGEQPAPSLLVRGVDVVVRTESGLAIRSDCDVRIDGDRIARVTPAAERVDAAPGAVIVDGKGRTLLPGLVDLSVVVLDPVDLDRALAAGVTTMRCLDAYGWLTDELDARRAAGIPSPRCVVHGPDLRRSIAARGERDVPTERIAAAVGEVERLVLEQRDTGYEGCTLGPDAPPWIVDAALRASARHGVPLALDVPGTTNLTDALRAGSSLGSLEATLGPWLAWNGAGFEHDVPTEHTVAEAVDEIRGEGATVVTGLTSVDAALGLLDSGEPVLARDLVLGTWAPDVRCQGPLGRSTLERLPPLVRAVWSPAAHQMRRGLPSNFAPRMRVGRRLLDIAAVRLDSAGMPLAIGSGAGRPFQVVGPATVDEIERVVEAGVDRARALEAATWNGARALGLEDVGEIREGARADLLLVEGNPLVDAGALRRPVGVFVDGRYVPREESDERVRTQEARAALEADFIVTVTLEQDPDRAVAQATTPPRETTLRTLCEIYMTRDVPRPAFAFGLAAYAATVWPDATWPARLESGVVESATVRRQRRPQNDAPDASSPYRTTSSYGTPRLAR